MSKPRPQPGLKYAAVLRRRNLKKGVMGINETHHPCNENKLIHATCLAPNTALSWPWNKGQCGIWTLWNTPPPLRRSSSKNEAGVHLVHQVVLRESASSAWSWRQVCYALFQCQIFSVDQLEAKVAVDLPTYRHRCFI